jgi:hypothetical protein
MSGVWLELAPELLNGNPQVMDPIEAARTPYRAKNLFVREHLSVAFGKHSEDFVQLYGKMHFSTARADAAG